MSSSKNLTHCVIGTTLAEIVTLPICTTKTRYQNSTNITIPNTLRTIYRDGGIRAFFSGSFPAITAQVISTSCKYTLYRKLEKEETLGSLSYKPVNGIVSGVLVSLVTHPFDFLKNHWQMKTPIRPIIKEHGYKILYRAYSKSFLKTSISSAFFFPLFDKFKEKLETPTFGSLTPFQASVVGGFTSSILSTTAMQPLDYLKNRHLYNLSYWEGWSSIYFKGLSLNLARIVPHFTIIMTTIEWLKMENIG